jgi:hypothetical protein
MSTNKEVAELEKPEHQSMFAASNLFDDDHPEHYPRLPWPPWIVTFADMVMLLLAFFVLLLSFSDLDPTPKFLCEDLTIRQTFIYDPADPNR